MSSSVYGVAIAGGGPVGCTAAEKILAEQPSIFKRMRKTLRVLQVYIEADFSNRSACLHGDRWLLTGDDARFIDPIFSSDVFLSMVSGEPCSINPSGFTYVSRLAGSLHSPNRLHVRVS